MKFLTTFLPVFAAASFVWSVLFLAGKFFALNSSDLFSYVTFSDVINLSIPTVASQLVVATLGVIIVAALVPKMISDTASIFSAREGKADLSAGKTKFDETNFTRSPPTKKQWLGAFACITLLAGTLIATFYFQLSSRIFTSLMTGALEAAAAFFSSLLMTRFFKKTVAGALALFIYSLCFSFGAGFLGGLTPRDCPRSYEVRTASGTTKSAELVILERGVGLLEPSLKQVEFIPWSEVKSVRTLPRKKGQIPACAIEISIPS